MISYLKNIGVKMLCFVLSFSFFTCEQEQATLILYHGKILTLDINQPEVQAIACRGDKIIALGSSKEITQKYFREDCKMVDLNGQFAMPGFIEGHGHFKSMGDGLSQLDLLHTDSWAAILDSIRIEVKNTPPGNWVYGRGWHQEKWNDSLLQTVGGYPLHQELSAVSPNNPVLLIHASGHALMTNEFGMKHLTMDNSNPPGGQIIRNDQNEMTGIFEETAMRLIKKEYYNFINLQSKSQKDSIWLKTFEMAQNHCLRQGITSFQDAGSSFDDVDHYLSFDEGSLFDIRLSVMLYESISNMKKGLDNFPLQNSLFFKANAIKTYADGALGSYGAYLLKPYNDKPDQKGQRIVVLDSLYEIANLAIQNNMQLCVHAIGDKSNREILDITEKLILEKKLKQDHRWRIEHAQHLDPADIPRFKNLGVIASIQTKHCTSDAPFVEKRLGKERAKNGAYVWRSLLDAGAHLANGTDVPVEEMNPFANLYSAVTRKSAPEIDAFYPKQSMTRMEALQSYTIWNAYANFEENIKGSLTVGKLADIVVLSENLVDCKDEEILDTKVLYTIVGGEVKYADKSN